MSYKYTLGIVRGFHGGKCFLYCPLIRQKINPSIVLPGAKLGDKLIVDISGDHVTLHKNYGNFNIPLILDLFTHTDTLHHPPLITNKSLYTQPFKNLNHLHTFTIDPTTSKDFDDAISLDISNNLVYVHIVDIHNQLPIDSDVDIKAVHQATTIYLPDHVHNMIPDELANDKFSLIKDQERRVITVEMLLCDNNITHYEIYPSTIIVKERYDYQQANENLHTPHLDYLNKFASYWHKNKLVIPSVKFDHQGSVSLEYNNDTAHKIIECLMVSANVIVSQYLQESMKLPQRYHEKLGDVKMVNHCDNIVVNSFITIKQYAKANYELDKSGHFGLDIPSYTHFTSPIRRYFDVIIHRMLAGVVYPEDYLKHLLTHINDQNNKCDDLCRLYHRWKLVEHLNRSAQKIYTAYIVGINAAGINYLIPDLMLDGFVHVSKIMEKRWVYNDDKLVSDTLELTLGSKILIHINKINMITSEIETSVVKV